MHTKAYKYQCVSCHRPRQTGEKFSRHGLCDKCSTMSLVLSSLIDGGMSYYIETARGDRFEISFDMAETILSEIKGERVEYQNRKLS